MTETRGAVAEKMLLVPCDVRFGYSIIYYIYIIYIINNNITACKQADYQISVLIARPSRPGDL